MKRQRTKSALDEIGRLERKVKIINMLDGFTVRKIEDLEEQSKLQTGDILKLEEIVQDQTEKIEKLQSVVNGILRDHDNFIVEIMKM